MDTKKIAENYSNPGGTLEKLNNLKPLISRNEELYISKEAKKKMLLHQWANHADQRKSIGNLRTTTTTLSTTTGSELRSTAQARPVNFVFLVSSTTPNKVESHRPAIHRLRQV